MGVCGVGRLPRNLEKINPRGSFLGGFELRRQDLNLSPPAPQTPTAQDDTSNPPERRSQTCTREAPIDPDLARVAAAWPDLQPHIKAAVLALLTAAPSLDFAASFTAAFDRIDRERGSHNFVSLVLLRQAVPADRAAFDAGLRELRVAGRFTLSGAEGRHGLTAEEQAAGIREDGSLLLYASRKV